MTFPIPTGALSVIAAVNSLALRGAEPDTYAFAVAQRNAWRSICRAILDGRLHAYVLDGRGHSNAARCAQFAALQEGDYLAVDDIPLQTENGDVHGLLFFFENELTIGATEAVVPPLAAIRFHESRSRSRATANLKPSSSAIIIRTTTKPGARPSAFRRTDIARADKSAPT